MTDVTVDVPGINKILRERNKSWGRAGVYMNPCSSYNQITDLPFEEQEAIWSYSISPKAKPIVI